MAKNDDGLWRYNDVTAHILLRDALSGRERSTDTQRTSTMSGALIFAVFYGWVMFAMACLVWWGVRKFYDN